MSPFVRLVLCLHNHQPVGNFDGVFEAAYQDSYAPFLEILDEYPDLPIALHTSGSLMEWIVDRHPEYIDRLRRLVERGQVEIIGGPFFEPIMAAIPRRDRIGQIRAYSRYLADLFDVSIRGIWIPERVWEPTFAGDITQAGIEYTIVDDFHFRGAGLNTDQLHGYYLTEDEGRLLKIFPGSERLRYTIPFQEPAATIDHLRGFAEKFPGSVIAFGDDGEKFGTWPGTKQHVYQDRWLRKFLDALMANRDWLRVCTMAEAVDEVPPQGKVYLPNASYREMTEWVLPPDRQNAYLDVVHRKEHDPDWPLLRQFVYGGFWRNFLAKYPESNEMYCRVREISDRIADLEKSSVPREQPEAFHEAQTELYRAQCNCPYWHGAFGGLYLPHLRNAIYHHAIAAENLVESLSGRSGKWVDISIRDFNLDARQEIRLAGDRLVAYLAPARGGHLYELDIRQAKLNALATLNRQPEAYHQKILHHAQHQHAQEGKAVSIHDLVNFKQPDLDKKLAYDGWPRKSLVDHFLAQETSLTDFSKGHGLIGDFETGVYESRIRFTDRRIEAVLSRKGHAAAHQPRVTKSVVLDTSSSNLLEIKYDLDELPAHEPLRFAVEFNFAGLAAGADDRYFYDESGSRLGRLESLLDLSQKTRLGLVDEWLGVDLSLESSAPAGVWTLPIQTVSQSEAGFELVHQSSCVVLHWLIAPNPDRRWSTTLRLTADTSMVQARQLASLATSP